MFTDNVKRGRGRPAGPTAQAVETRDRLYATAVGLIAARGYEATTMRDISAAAGVSVGLLYRYFPNKHAVLLSLYDELSAGFARDAAQLRPGRWRDRFIAAVRASLQTLTPHRQALRALTPVLVGDPVDGVFAPRTAFSRHRVQQVFVRAVAEASDAPRAPLAEALGRTLYLVHLGVLLWWLLDRSRDKRASEGLVAAIAALLPSAAVAMRLPPVRGFVMRVDALMLDGLFADQESSH